MVFAFGPQYMRNRQVLFFVDNTSCLAACVHGYVRSPYLTALSNALHLPLALLKCLAWWEYVPSEAKWEYVPSQGLPLQVVLPGSCEVLQRRGVSSLTIADVSPLV